MVYARIDELKNYLEPTIYSKVKIFLEEINEDMPEGKYPIWDDRVFARVMSSETSLPEKCKIEAHDKYIDIQATIIGAEGISVYERKALTESVPYNIEKDVVLFEQQKAEVYAHTINIPGYFTMLYPEDAHRPQERVRNIGRVKKFVIKVAL